MSFTSDLARSDRAHSRRGFKSVGLKSSTKDHLEGTARTVAGILKEETGKSVGNPELEAEGDADQFVGFAQQKIATIKEAFGN
jgi:uncharacterized protein YjbJ (UPF0337 family)